MSNFNLIVKSLGYVLNEDLSTIRTKYSQVGKFGNIITNYTNIAFIKSIVEFSLMYIAINGDYEYLKIRQLHLDL